MNEFPFILSVVNDLFPPPSHPEHHSNEENEDNGENSEDGEKNLRLRGTRNSSSIMMMKGNDDEKDKSFLLQLSNILIIYLKKDHHLEKDEINHRLSFYQWLSNLWRSNIQSDYQGWNGTLINIQDNLSNEMIQIKSGYVLSLELFYHFRNLPMNHNNDETCFTKKLMELLISEEMEEVMLEHYSMLGLYFYLRRTMSYEGFQYLGNLPPTIRCDCMSSGDICRDFIHAVDAYFATQIVWKVIGISSQGSMRALSNKYEELMEMYFRIKCYFANGLIKSSIQTTWKNVVDHIHDIFQTIQFNSLRLSEETQSFDESQEINRSLPVSPPPSSTSL